RFTHEQQHYEAHQAVNALFARQLVPLLEAGDTVWIHDYHLIPLARQLRQLGFAGPLGFFLHIPFPHLQVLRLLPRYAELVRDLCQYDLVGFQTQDDVQCFRSAVDPQSPQTTRANPESIEIGGRRVRAGAYPIGIEVDEVAREARATVVQESVQRTIKSLM